MLVAARKHFHTNEELAADLDESTGAIHIYGVKKSWRKWPIRTKKSRCEAAQTIRADAEIDSEIRIPKPTDALGRISAQTAKQVILQKVREAERENIYSEYSGRVGRAGHMRDQARRRSGSDRRIWARPKRACQERAVALESFSVGDRVRCVIKIVDKAGKNAGVIVSRAAPELVMRLFEQEVPGDLRQHRDHQGLRARSRRAHQDRRVQPRPRRR